MAVSADIRKVVNRRINTYAQQGRTIVKESRPMESESVIKRLESSYRIVSRTATNTCLHVCCTGSKIIHWLAWPIWIPATFGSYLVRLTAWPWTPLDSALEIPAIMSNPQPVWRNGALIRWLEQGAAAVRDWAEYFQGIIGFWAYHIVANIPALKFILLGTQWGDGLKVFYPMFKVDAYWERRLNSISKYLKGGVDTAADDVMHPDPATHVVHLGVFLFGLLVLHVDFVVRFVLSCIYGAHTIAYEEAQVYEKRPILLSMVGYMDMPDNAASQLNPTDPVFKLPGGATQGLLLLAKPDFDMDKATPEQQCQALQFLVEAAWLSYEEPHVIEDVIQTHWACLGRGIGPFPAQESTRVSDSVRVVNFISAVYQNQDKDGNKGERWERPMNTQCYVFTYKDAVILAFRGSQPGSIMDWFYDFSINSLTSDTARPASTPGFVNIKAWTNFWSNFSPRSTTIPVQGSHRGVARGTLGGNSGRIHEGFALNLGLPQKDAHDNIIAEATDTYLQRYGVSGNEVREGDVPESKELEAILTPGMYDPPIPQLGQQNIHHLCQYYTSVQGVSRLDAGEVGGIMQCDRQVASAVIDKCSKYADEFAGQQEFLRRIIALGGRDPTVTWLNPEQVNRVCSEYQTLNKVSQAKPLDFSVKVPCSYELAAAVINHCKQYVGDVQEHKELLAIVLSPSIGEPAIKGLTQHNIQLLCDTYISVKKVSQADPVKVADQIQISTETAKKVISRCRKYVGTPIGKKGISPYTYLKALVEKEMCKGANGKRKLYVTGHSLGGALATVFASKFANDVAGDKKQVYLATFGQPSLGDEDTAKRIDGELLPGNHYLRVVNLNDLVPRVPAFFMDKGSPMVHAGKLWYINEELEIKMIDETADDVAQQEPHLRDLFFLAKQKLSDAYELLAIPRRRRARSQQPQPQKASTLTPTPPTEMPPGSKQSSLRFLVRAALTPIMVLNDHIDYKWALRNITPGWETTAPVEPGPSNSRIAKAA